MNMFQNYYNIPDTYIPNNMSCDCSRGKSYTKLDPIEGSKPFEEYNAKGELIGYFWRYGETLNLEFNIDGEIIVESDAVILKSTGEEPSKTSKPRGNRAYNIIDMRSWTCVGYAYGEYIWQEDLEFTYPQSGLSVYVSAADYLKDKFIEFTLYNFKRQPILTKKFEGTTQIIVPIDIETSKSLTKGLYYCSLTVVSEDIVLPIFDNNDCLLLVK